MLYVFIDGFPNVLERCLANVENGRIAIHLLCTYLSSFTALFSVYYHRVKILTVNSIPLSLTVAEFIRKIFKMSELTFHFHRKTYRVWSL